jgi:general secretion pathway protein I
LNARRGSGGFTVVEVLVALVIVALALSAIALRMMQMTDTAYSLRERSYASWIAENRITEMRLANVVPEVSSTSGEVRFAGTDWSWRAVVSETGVENLFRVEVTVSYPGSDDRIRTVTGFIGEPTIPGLANRIWNHGPAGSGSQT